MSGMGKTTAQVASELWATHAALVVAGLQTGSFAVILNEASAHFAEAELKDRGNQSPHSNRWNQRARGLSSVRHYRHDPSTTFRKQRGPLVGMTVLLLGKARYGRPPA
jgi:hypothetical protein